MTLNLNKNLITNQLITTIRIPEHTFLLQSKI